MRNPHRAQSQVNPQRENGRREIANDVFRALMQAGLSGGEYQVVLTVIDGTWGWDKPSGLISLSQFEQATGLSRKGITKTIKNLEIKGVIVICRNGTKGSEYLFNKHFDTWKVGSASEPQHPSASEPEFTSPQAQLVNHDTPESGQQLVNQGTPDWCTGVHQPSEPGFTSASELATPATEPVKKGIKETSKESLKERGFLFTLWNTLKVVKHKQPTDKMESALKAALKVYSVEELGQAMRNYADVLFSEEHYWSHRWTLDEFLRRGLEKFMDRDVALANYRIEKGGPDDRASRGREAEATGRYDRQHSAAELRESLGRPRGSAG